MIFHPTGIAGAYVVEQERVEDERGYFARSWAVDEFFTRGLDARVAQMNTSFNVRAGTLRGLHFQLAPHEEAKLVRATRGAVWDVAVDLRRDSPTYRRWHAVELTDDSGLAYFVPAGCAHGFQSLVDASEVFYVMSTPFVSPAAAGVRWDDPAFGIAWPDPPRGGRTMSERDRAWPDFQP